MFRKKKRIRSSHILAIMAIFKTIKLKIIPMHVEHHFCDFSYNYEHFWFSRLFSVSMATVAILKILKLEIISTHVKQYFCQVSSSSEHFCFSRLFSCRVWRPSWKPITIFWHKSKVLAPGSNLIKFRRNRSSGLSSKWIQSFGTFCWFPWQRRPFWKFQDLNAPFGMGIYLPVKFH